MLDLTFPKSLTSVTEPAPRAPAPAAPKASTAQVASAAAAAPQAVAPAPVASTAAVPQASSPQASSVAAPAASTADSRATAFEAVQGGTETKSGTVLMVEAYAIIWVLLAGWVLLTFRKAERMHARLQDLEAALDRAAAAKDSKTGKGAAGS